MEQNLIRQLVLANEEDVAAMDRSSALHDYAGSKMASSSSLKTDSSWPLLVVSTKSSTTPSISNLLQQPSVVPTSSMALLRAQNEKEMEREILKRRIRELDRDLLVSSARRPPLLSSFLEQKEEREAAVLRPFVTPSSISSVLETTRATSMLEMMEQASQYRQAALDRKRRILMLKLSRQQALQDQQEQQRTSSKSSAGKKTDCDQAWEAMFQQLFQYRIRNGNCLVKDRDYPKLGTWVRNQRTRKKLGRMTPERVRRLDSINFVWAMAHKETWDAMFQRLLAFRRTHGHCKVPRTYKPDPRLGRWVDTQRNKCRDDMSDERKQRLHDIGFIWKVHNQTWDDMFNRLLDYKEKHGNCLVPSNYAHDRKLGTWVHVQRSRQGVLPDSRRERLDKIGFMWSAVGLKRKNKENEL